MKTGMKIKLKTVAVTHHKSKWLAKELLVSISMIQILDRLAVKHDLATILIHESEDHCD